MFDCAHALPRRDAHGGGRPTRSIIMGLGVRNLPRARVAKPRSKLADCPPTDRECVGRFVRSVISFSSVSLFALVIITGPLRGGDRS